MTEMIQPSSGNILVFAPMHNTKGKHDATGAFQPEAKRFCDCHLIPHDNMRLVDNKKSKKWQKKFVLEAINDFGTLDSIAFFCHGFRSGIQFGIKIQDVDSLANAIYIGNVGTRGCTYPIVTFNSCDVARNLDRDREDDKNEVGGDGGFADEVRDALCRAGLVYCRVVGHSTTGHTDKNPFSKFFDGNGSPVGGHGGIMPVSYKGNKALWKKWVNALRKDPEFRFQFPYMTISDIHRYLLEQ